jgi:hypothetical protein
MLKLLSWIELLLSASLLLVALWAMLGICDGCPYSYDCEVWLIFGVNLFFPVGALGLVCSIWSLKRESWRPQYGLV